MTDISYTLDDLKLMIDAEDVGMMWMSLRTILMVLILVSLILGEVYYICKCIRKPKYQQKLRRINETFIKQYRAKTKKKKVK